MIRMVNTFFSVVLAAAVTFTLFFLMQLLIKSDLEVGDLGERTRVADISLPEQELEVQRVTPKPDKIEDVLDIPDLPEPEFNPNAPQTASMQLQRVEINLDGLDTGLAVGTIDSEYLPIVTVPPQYPSRALQREIEGWCQVSFTVNELGGVEDAVVLEGEPAGMFDSASLRAVRRFKFNPRTDEGEPVRTLGVSYVFTFKLDD